MTKKEPRGPQKSDRPRAVVAAALKEKRDAFLHTFFKRGAEITDEIVIENHRLRDQLAQVEEENASLKTQLASDRAIRDLLRKIDDLEREKSRLLSTVHEQEEITGRISNRFAEVETELESFANLYVASFQLHISLGVRRVLRHVKELLGQLVGARTLAVYFTDEARTRLVPIASDGIELEAVKSVPLGEGAPSDPVAVVVERVFLTGVAHVSEGRVETPPAACIPLQIEDRTVGAIAIFTLLDHKKHFVTVDRELFKLLGAHAAVALIGSYHFGRADEHIPTPEELRAITG
jgi:hypothetical protein